MLLGAVIVAASALGIVVYVITRLLFTEGKFDYREKGEITFAKGTSQTTVKAEADSNGPECWTFRAASGQAIRAVMVSQESEARFVMNPFTKGSQFEGTLKEINDRGTTSYTPNLGGRSSACLRRDFGSQKDRDLLTVEVTD